MHSGTPSEQRCQWPDCAEAGLYPAPKNPAELDRHCWFCLSHVRQYNAQWDYFKGRSREEVETYRWSSVTGHRPTWPMSHRAAPPGGTIDDAIDILGLKPGLHPFGRKGPHRPASGAERQALATLGLDETATVAEIKKRYKQLVKQYHPDTHGGTGMEDRLKRIIKAYGDLKKSGRLAVAVA